MTFLINQLVTAFIVLIASCVGLLVGLEFSWRLILVIGITGFLADLFGHWRLNNR